MVSLAHRPRQHAGEISRSGDVPETSWRFLLLITTAVVAVTTAFNISFHTGPGIYTAVYEETGHLIRRSLIAGVLLLALVLIASTYGGLRPRHLGWQWSKLGAGLAATAAVFVAMQVVEVVVTVANGDQPRLSTSWSGVGWATAMGVLLGYAIGVAPAEETFFRGLLLPQLRLKFSPIGPAVAVGMALVLSSLVFALYHLPGLLLDGASSGGTAALDIAIELGRLFTVGMLYAALYLRTGNLFLVIGIHALGDAGTSVVAAPIDPGWVILGLATIVLLGTFAPPVARRLRGLDSPMQRGPRPLP
jgi:membrane protease YdiL (CAAX protease family)